MKCKSFDARQLTTFVLSTLPVIRINSWWVCSYTRSGIVYWFVFWPVNRPTNFVIGYRKTFHASSEFSSAFCVKVVFTRTGHYNTMTSTTHRSHYSGQHADMVTCASQYPCFDHVTVWQDKLVASMIFFNIWVLHSNWRSRTCVVENEVERVATSTWLIAL